MELIRRPDDLQTLLSSLLLDGFTNKTAQTPETMEDLQRKSNIVSGTDYAYSPSFNIICRGNVVGFMDPEKFVCSSKETSQHLETNFVTTIMQTVALR
jgi:hypothetical protein